MSLKLRNPICVLLSLCLCMMLSFACSDDDNNSSNEDNQSGNNNSSNEDNQSGNDNSSNKEKNVPYLTLSAGEEVGSPCDYDTFVSGCASENSYYRCAWDTKDQGVIALNTCDSNTYCTKFVDKSKDTGYTGYNCQRYTEDWDRTNPYNNGKCTEAGETRDNCYGTGAFDTYLVRYECQKDIYSDRLYWNKVDSISCKNCQSDDCTLD